MPNITVYPVVLRHQKRRDGTWNVKLRISFRGESRYLPTTVTATTSDLTRSMAIKSPEVLNKLSASLVEVRSAISEIRPFDLEGKTVDWVVARIKQSLSGEVFRLDFLSFGRGWARETKKGTTLQGYLRALDALERYIGPEIDVNAITRKMLLGFAASVEKTPKLHKTRDGWKERKEMKMAGSSARHLAKLAAIFREARYLYNDEDAGLILIPRSPFDGIRKTPPPSKQRKPVEDVVLQRIIDAQTDPLTREALDAFLLSFVAMGANLADLHEAAALPDGAEWWTFNRKKVRERRPDGAEVRVKVTPQMTALIRRLQDGPEGWLAPAFHRIGAACDTATGKINARLRDWADAEGVPRFSFGAARHTWATVSRRLGVEKSTGDEAMGHVGDFKVYDMYAVRNWEIPAQANAKVLGAFDWSAILF